MISRPDIVISLASIGRASPECEQAMKDWRTAKDAADKKRQEFVLAYRQTAEYAALRRLVGYNCHPDITEEGIRIPGTLMPHQGGIHWDYNQSHVYGLDPKTLNMLLSGKLLSDTEKRELLKRHGVTFDSAKDPTP